ncbi:hypothetical protein A3C87_00485 [Candidatus Kaiserbacteria bacterium RIFCSPHIGHO2_02_FULL_49_34]|uniref:Uncharacterized protein n=1 Tax=Candidatus Kaiserbacteria bacterium RIFCSPHIGHO2_02_FULL_49_34 TaxID=1798491 RepID=A0A1F6DKA7_9BACT|nr:MAG: hypothetical protein A3C87_00485 [Candidatus Kaiserbacteria bacterium RIFCSPHIGHO2_02_FULL_49_34]
MKKTQKKASLLKISIFSVLFLLLSAAPLYFIAEKSVRNTMQTQAEMFVQKIDTRLFTSLTGTRDDLDTPAYKELKSAFITLKEPHDNIAFLYTAGIRNAAYRAKTGDIRDEKEVFFYLDSEPEDSYDISLPGDIYDDASRALYNLFETGEPYIVGPETDAWGTWVSVLLPIGGDTLETRIAFGVDYHAETYTRTVLWHLFKLMSIPLLILCIGLGIYWRKKK